MSNEDIKDILVSLKIDEENINECINNNSNIKSAIIEREGINNIF